MTHIYVYIYMYVCVYLLLYWYKSTNTDAAPLSPRYCLGYPAFFCVSMCTIVPVKQVN